MVMGPAISAADLLRAFAAIQPKTDGEKRAIAGVLGFDWQAPSPIVPPRPPPAKPNPVSDLNRPTLKPMPAPMPARGPGDSPRHEGDGLRISAPRRVSRPQLDWLNAGPALQPGKLGRAHDPAPLFRPQWTRAILGASLSAIRPIGPPDLARAIDVIARGQALRSVPRQPIMTFARGVQVLIDIGESMQPFWQDRTALRRDLNRIVGDGSLEILQFVGSPGKMRRDDRSRMWKDYEAHFLAQLDACVLIVSDFGIGGGLGLARGASPYAWAMLARRLARSGHRVVGFVPYPPRRWPALLSRAIHLVQWDRGTTAGRISLSRARSQPA